MDRIQKVLANQGIGSRRQIDALLQEGRIQVNGHTAKPGDQVVHLTDLSSHGTYIVG